MADAKDPLRQLIDVAVYAPIGLILLVQKELPNLVAAGKSRVDSQITLARFIGKLAVKRGSQAVRRRLDAAEAARKPLDSVVDADSVETSSWSDPSSNRADAGDPTSDDDQTIPPAARTLPVAIITAVNAVAEATDLGEALQPQPSVALPIDGYDSLAASQVVVRLGTLTDGELDEIRRHEESHRARRTILGKISQLQAR